MNKAPSKVERNGITYNSPEEAEFYDLLCKGKVTEALIFAALNYKKIGTYALDVAAKEYQRLELARRA